MKLLSFLVRHSRARMALVSVASTISGVSSILLIALFNAELKKIGGAGVAPVLWFAALCIFLSVTRFVSEALLTRLSQDALFSLRMRLSRQILDVPLQHLEELGAHRLMAILTDDIPTITNALLNIPIISMNIAIIISGLVYLGWLSTTMLMMVLVFMVVGIISYQLPVIKAMSSLRAAREESDNLYNHFRDLTEGIKELKLHHRRRGAFLKQVLEPTAGAFRRHNVTGMTIYAAAASWGQALVFVIIGLFMLVLPALTRNDYQTMTGYIITLLYLMTPFQVVMNSIPALSRANVALQKVEGLSADLSSFKKESELSGSPDSLSCERLDMIGVSYTYRREGGKGDFTLGPIDLTLWPGELVFLIGGNGSGKTTLAKLLLGLYTPESGEIRLNGQTVTDENREYYRQHFSVVFADFHLFESLLGLDQPNLDYRARSYLNLLQLEQKVEIKDGALSTTKLSQGQRKRLALLVAYIENRPVYVFDEWAADQDPMFKGFFYHSLLPELKARGKAVLVISHDDHYYGVADRIIKVESGQVEFDAAARESRQTASEKTIPFPQ